MGWVVISLRETDILGLRRFRKEGFDMGCLKDGKVA